MHKFVLKSGLTVGIFDISTFSMVSSYSLLHLMEIFPVAHNFFKKHIVKHCFTVFNYVEIAKIYK